MKKDFRASKATWDPKESGVTLAFLALVAPTAPKAPKVEWAP